MDRHALHKALIEIAAQSPAKKRKVGAAVVSITTAEGKPLVHEILAEGWNFNPSGGPCEIDGETHPDVQHAEVTALNDFLARKYIRYTDREYVLFITHEPCNGCRAAMMAAGISRYEVVGEFMKFDGSKVRYDLVPPSAILAIAEVLTYGARKYKPGNWRKTDDPSRYVAAAMRHFERYRQGEEFDEESGLHHLAHCMTNLAFLIELDHTPEPGVN